MMTNLHRSVARWVLPFALALTGIAGAQSASPVGGDCPDCGVVRSVRLVETRGSASGVGAVAGGVMGGVIGHQFGSGRGNTAATIAGAGAGAYAGHQVEKNRNSKSSWNVAVTMQNGTTRNFTFANKPQFRSGDRVRTVDGGRRIALLAQ